MLGGKLSDIVRKAVGGNPRREFRNPVIRQQFSQLSNKVK